MNRDASIRAKVLSMAASHGIKARCVDIWHPDPTGRFNWNDGARRGVIDIYQNQVAVYGKDDELVPIEAIS